MRKISAGLAGFWALAAAVLVACSGGDGEAPAGGAGSGASGTSGAGAGGAGGGKGGLGGMGGEAGASGAGGQGGTASGSFEYGGGLINHSMNKLAGQLLGQTAELSQISAAVVDQTALAADASVAPLGSAPVDTTSAKPPIGFAIPGVDLSGVSGGLITRIFDARASDRLWMTTETGFGPLAQVAALKGTASTTAARAFAVSFDAVEAVVAPMAKLTKEQLVERGFVFGLVYSAVSADGSGAPVIGATAVPSDPSFTVIYPNNMFTGTAPSTTNQGAFLAIPAEAGAARAVTFTITPPAGQSYTWDQTQQALARPGVIHFILLYPQ